MTAGSSRALALSARAAHLEALIKGVPGLVQACLEGARVLATQAAEPALYARRRDLVLDMPAGVPAWRAALGGALQQALVDVRLGRPVGQRQGAGSVDVPLALSLVDNSDVERDLTASRLAQAIADLTGSEFTDLSARLQAIGGLADPAAQASDVLAGSWLAQQVLRAWLGAGLSPAHWQTLQTVLHQESAHWVQGGYHEANHLLLTQGVRPEIDLRPFIRRGRDVGSAWPAVTTVPGGNLGGSPGRGGRPSQSGGFAGSGGAGHDATHLMPVSPVAARSGASSQAVLGRLAAFMARQVPGFSISQWGSAGGRTRTEPTSVLAPASGHVGAGAMVSGLASDAVARPSGAASGAAPGAASALSGPATQGHSLQASTPPGAPSSGAPTVSPALGEAIAGVEARLRRQGEPTRPGEPPPPGGPGPTPEATLRELEQGKATLKAAAASPIERATIEVVALLFQSILTEERLPAAVRVWFARLQMPVLRVAVGEPDFFASTNHPARRLIDRMGSCVMGFVDGGEGEASGDALHTEIKRIVQVVEAYPDTGRRVFQTVLTEFERFLETYFRDEHAASRKGVSLAQQVEQRETWAIQYTIELRKMLADVPVHEGVREFLFRVWADVLAHSAVQSGQASTPTRELKRAAADLIWSASAKTSREERAEVLRRLPPLLRSVREGMMRAGLPQQAQDAHVQSLNAALAAAFSARSAPLSSSHLQEVTQRLEALDDILPDLAHVQLDEATLRDLSGHETEDLEVVAEGGSQPTPAMMAWARELQLGAWFLLDYRGRRERVQLAWQGLHRQLSLFVTPQGRGVLFQQHRLGAFLQAGLMQPLEDEPLTTRATRQALAKLDADPARLLG